MKCLPRCLTKPGFEALKIYLSKTEGALKRYQLSGRIADTFDQYLLFRPQMMLAWEMEQEDHWQAVLWREIIKEGEKEHRAALAAAFMKVLEDPSFRMHDIPERISVFGISALPRFHVQVLAGIAQLTKVNLFLMNPSREYWGDILSDWAIKRAIEKEDKEDLSTEELHLERGNALLASMGTLGRDFFNLVNEFDCEEVFSFDDPGDQTLLSCIQSDILNLRDRGQGSYKKKTLSREDRSIQIHSCHSPMREIEVLHDYLLDAFERNPDLLPKDVLVMTPDIETYAPYVQAVFDIPAADPKKIPFTIADQSIRKESGISDTFLSILDLCKGRTLASQVLTILESPAVRRRFGLSDGDLELVCKWVEDTRIRWGMDGPSRGDLGLPPLRDNTWQAGLERLLLGYAMHATDEELFNGLLPYDRIEGGETLVLGKFLEFVERLFLQIRSFGRSRTVTQWSAMLMDLLDQFFLPDEETGSEMQMIRSLLKDLGDVAEIAGFGESVDINVITWHLGHHLEREGFGFGFITGGVTFCAMLPMRSIPFKIICLVGMNGDSYPRQSRPLGFDLMAQNPQPGDRSRRNDDRYLFLEATLSAREALYISYVGQSIQDNSTVPPSVLVNELTDYLEQGFEFEEGEILKQIVTEHRLQAFSPEYFQDKVKQFSYSEENLLVAQRSLEVREKPLPFISMGLSEPGEEWKTVDLKDLCSFWSNPTRFLLTKRLGMDLGEKTSLVEDTESFEIKELEKYLLEQTLVEREVMSGDLKGFLPLAKASGLLPHGTVGECVYQNLSQGVERFVQKTRTCREGKKTEPLEVDLNVADFKLIGRIDSVFADRLLQYRYAKVKSRDYLRLWIHHLVLQCAEDAQYPRISVLAALHPTKGEPCLWQYESVKNSEELLKELLEHYWKGLVKPLHFFSETSGHYAHALLKQHKSESDALWVARTTWNGSDFKRGEKEDPYYQCCFKGAEPLDEAFQILAGKVFGPLLSLQKEVGT